MAYPYYRPPEKFSSGFGDKNRKKSGSTGIQGVSVETKIR
jgi:hypothetical protein